MSIKLCCKNGITIITHRDGPKTNSPLDKCRRRRLMFLARSSSRFRFVSPPFDKRHGPHRHRLHCCVPDSTKPLRPVPFWVVVVNIPVLELMASQRGQLPSTLHRADLDHRWLSNWRFDFFPQALIKAYEARKYLPLRAMCSESGVKAVYFSVVWAYKLGELLSNTLPPNLGCLNFRASCKCFTSE